MPYQDLSCLLWRSNIILLSLIHISHTVSTVWNYWRLWVILYFARQNSQQSKHEIVLFSCKHRKKCSDLNFSGLLFERIGWSHSQHMFSCNREISVWSRVQISSPMSPSAVSLRSAVTTYRICKLSGGAWLSQPNRPFSKGEFKAKRLSAKSQIYSNSQ